jgi:hypothetical protein
MDAAAFLNFEHWGQRQERQRIGTAVSAVGEATSHQPRKKEH